MVCSGSEFPGTDRSQAKPRASPAIPAPVGAPGPLTGLARSRAGE